MYFDEAKKIIDLLVWIGITLIILIVGIVIGVLYG